MLQARGFRNSRWIGVFIPVLIVASLAGVAEVVLALSGVEPLANREDPYVGFTSYLPLFVGGYDHNSVAIENTAENKIRYFNPQQFLAAKPANGYRVFCLGGSTTYGHPYDDATSFSGWLRAFLPKADPSRHWEIVNCGGISYASYRIALLMEELCQYEPDLFIVYTGHNEFLERRTYQGVINTSPMERRIGTLLAKTRIYSFIKQRIDPSPAVAPEHLLPSEVDTILDNSVGPAAYHRDDTYRNLVRAHFEFNLDRMVQLAREAGAEILFITPASNLRDCSPFKSEAVDGLVPEAQDLFQAHMGRALDLLAHGKLPDAVIASEDALAIDDRHAEAHYLRGLALWRLGDYEDARQAFERALDEDVCPLRASRPIVEEVRDAAAAQDVALIDFARALDDLSEHGTPGNDWFLDHVHPAIEGHRRLALMILDNLIAEGAVHPSRNWGPEAIAQVTMEIEGAVDSIAHGRAMLTVAQVYLWGGKYDEARAAAKRARELSPGDWMVYCVLADWARVTGNLDEAVSWQRQAIERNPENELLRRQLEELIEMQATEANQER